MVVNVFQNLVVPAHKVPQLVGRRCAVDVPLDDLLHFLSDELLVSSDRIILTMRVLVAMLVLTNMSFCLSVPRTLFLTRKCTLCR